MVGRSFLVPSTERKFDVNLLRKSIAFRDVVIPVSSSSRLKAASR